MPDLPVSEMHKRLDAPGSDVWKVHYEAEARLRAGEDILLLSVGDPDFNTPRYISDHVIEQINAGRTHYSPAAGEPRLRQAVADIETTSTGTPFSPDQVTIFPGATATLQAVLSCILDPGSRIAIPEPMYIGYRGVLSGLGADVVSVPMPAPDFQLDTAAVIEALDSDVRALLVNTPNNPCGSMIEPAVLTELAAECRKRDIWMICDEVYSLITFEQPHTSLLNCTDDLSNVVVIDGLSKSHAMSGWRIGWAIADLPMSEALERHSSATLFGTSQFAQDGAAYALAHNADVVEEMRQQYQARRDTVLRRISQSPGLTASKPQGGMFVMISAAGMGLDGDTLSRALLDECGISTLPGSGFGESARDYVRLSLTYDAKILDDACARIANWCGQRQGKD